VKVLVKVMAKVMVKAIVKVMEFKARMNPKVKFSKVKSPRGSFIHISQTPLLHNPTKITNKRQEKVMLMKGGRRREDPAGVKT